MTEAYADLKIHQQTHESVYKDSNEAEGHHSLFDDITNDSDIIHSSERDWKLEHVENVSPENLDQNNQDSDDFRDDETDIIIRGPSDIQMPEDIQFPKEIQDSNDIQHTRDIQGEKQEKTDVAQEECYEAENDDSVIAKVMSNKAFLAKKTAKNRRYSKVCNNNDLFRITSLKTCKLYKPWRRENTCTMAKFSMDY